LDFSIVIPVFNREDLTQQCLSTLLPTLAGAGTGEVIVVDNGSEPATAAVLAAHTWVRVIRNDKNLGFAAACNQGTRAAQGRYVVHLNNDTVGRDGWLAALLRVFAEEENVGVVGARLVFPDGTLQHAGVVSAPTRFGPEGFGPYHVMWKWPGNAAAALHRTELDVVTGACLVMERDVYLELGGFDEIYWNGYEDVDLCYKARARGLRVFYEPTAVLVHYESQSGIQRKRRVLHNIRELAARWRDIVVPDHNRWAERLGFVRREQFLSGVGAVTPPKATLIVHGPEPDDPTAWLRATLSARYPIADVVWCADGRRPQASSVRFASNARDALAIEVQHRGDRYVAVVDTRSRLERDWLNDLVDTVEFGGDICAATVVPPNELDPHAMPLTADARCVLLSMRAFPQHLAVDPTYATIDGSVASFVASAVALGRAVRAVRRPTAVLGPETVDAAYAERHGTTIALARRPDPERHERLLTPRPDASSLSVVLVTRDNLERAQNVVRSLRQFSAIPHELIVVDNGSRAEVRDAIAAFANATFVALGISESLAHARNIGAEHATGSHLLFLDDDAVVGPGALAALHAAFRDDATLGMTAPMTNIGANAQTAARASYADMDDFVRYARGRSEFAGMRQTSDYVDGFCMCISRTAWDAVGGFDPRFAIESIGAHAICLRVRAAGYGIEVCEDAFVHHERAATDARPHWPLLAQTFGLPAEMPIDPTEAYRAYIRRGFDADRRGTTPRMPVAR
jgi:GT2 family glycosyltransferase